MSPIEKQFRELLFSTKGHEAMKMNLNTKTAFRLNLRKGKSIKEDTMKRYLANAGIAIDDVGFIRSDLLSLVKYTIKLNQDAKKLGPEFVLEQWEKLKKMQKCP